MSTMPPTSPLSLEALLCSLPSPDLGELLDGQSVDPLHDDDPATEDDPAEGAVAKVTIGASFPASLPGGDSAPEPAPDNELEPTPDVEPKAEPEPGDAGTLFPRLPLLQLPNSSPASKPEPNNRAFEGEPGPPA